MRWLDHFKSWVPGMNYFRLRQARRRRIAELRRAIFLGRYQAKPGAIVEGLEKKRAFDDLGVDLPQE